MRVGVLGTGDVGKALGRGFAALGHEVKMGAREAGNEKAAAFVKEVGAKASQGTFAEVAQWAELIVLATLGSANESVVKMAGAGAFAGKIVLDTTNPLDFSGGFPPKLVRPGGVSGGEQVQQLLPGAKVVKCWNTVGNGQMFKPKVAGGPPTMFICGDDAAAKERVIALNKEFGWDTLDVGGIALSGHLESMCIVWVLTAAKSNAWGQAFKMLR